MEQVRTFVEPIKKKWVYHFIISPKTNLIEKPEWYLNQTIKWIHEYVDVVESKVKVDSKEDTSCSNVRHKFIICMLELVMMRLSKDMNKILISFDDDPRNEAILIHTYNEIIRFAKVMRKLLDDCYYDLEERHDVLSVFYNQKAFETITNVEWEYAQKNLKEITSSVTQWVPVLEGEYVDNYKIPTCVDHLLMLIKSITERVECFRQIDCQLKLIELQCFLFEKFLSYLKKSLESSPVSLNKLSGILFFAEESTIDLTRILRILNGVNLLRLVLKERYFIPNNVIEHLDKILMNKSDKVAQEYKAFFYRLVSKVVNIYEYVECDLQNFLNFIKPKLSHHIYDIIEDETAKINEQRKTQSLLQRLSFNS